MDPSDSAATPEEHALEDAIGNFLESGNKAGNYRDDALERVLTDWRQCLEARGTETVERVSKTRHGDVCERTLERQSKDCSDCVDVLRLRLGVSLPYCVKVGLARGQSSPEGIALDELPPRPTKRAATSSSGRLKIGKRYSGMPIVVPTRPSTKKGQPHSRNCVTVRSSICWHIQGTRGGEILSDPRDDRRNGLLWSDIDLESNQFQVLGKSQHEDEEVQLPKASASSTRAAGTSARAADT